MTYVVKFTRRSLRELAEPPSYERGEQYIGAVTCLKDTDDGVRATVHGSEPYRVLLYEQRGRLTGECDCPHGLQGYFCKHCVAVGLACLDRAVVPGPRGVPCPPAPAGADGGAGPERSRGGLRTALESLDRDALVEMVLAEAAADAELRRRLLRRCPAAEPSRPDVSVMTRQITRSLRVRAFVDYRGGREYARRVADVVGHLWRWENAGYHAETAELAALVVESVADAAPSLDDSSGAVAAAAADAARLHAAACTGAQPDQVALADWLLAFQLARHELPRLDVADYRAALGEEGMDAYAAALRMRWERERHGRGGPRLWTLTRLMEELTVADEDVDGFVEVVSADLACGSGYLRIATALERAGRGEQALAWAERGLREVAGPVDEGLADFVARCYETDGRHTDVLALRREQFERCRSVTTYGLLRAAALAADRRGRTWQTVRPLALDRLRADAGAATRWGWDRERHLTLIDVLLWEADRTTETPAPPTPEPRDGGWDPVEEAWHAAREVGATSRHWLTLAERREARAPEEAVEVFRREVDALVARKRNEGYLQAAELVERATAIYRRLGRDQEAAAYVEDLRTRYRARRNFMVALATRGL